MGIRLSIFLLFCLNMGTIAQVTAPTYSNEYLNIGVGARALSLGNSSVADPLPEEAGYWNPAFLMNLDSNSYVSLMHSEYFGGIAAYDFIAYAAPWKDDIKLSVGLIRLGIDDIPDTRLLYDASGKIDYNQLDFFSAADYALILSGARQISRWGDISFGANLKFIYRKAGDFASAYGLGIDIGTFMPIGDYVVSLMIRDVAGTFTVWSHSEELLEEVYVSTGNNLYRTSTELTLPQFQFGISGYLFKNNMINLKTLLAVHATIDGKRNTLVSFNPVSFDPAIGWELDYNNLLFLRTGFSKFQKIFLLDEWRAEWSVGSGLNYKGIKFHYALNRSNGFVSSHYSHTVSVNLRIDVK